MNNRYTRVQVIGETRFSQYMAVVIAALGGTATSTYLSWPSPTLPLLISKDSPLGKPISNEESSWIVSMITLSAIPPAITYHVLIGKSGRKATLHVASVFLFLSWLLIIFGDSVMYLYVARCIGGLAMGVVVITASMYTSEVADPDIRGKLGTLCVNMKTFGSIIVLSIGPFVSYAVLALVCALIPLLFFFLLFFIPESPYFLVKNGRMDEAREAITFLSGTYGKEIIDEKLKSISLFVHTTEKPLTVYQVISNRTYLKVLSILLIIIVCETFGGAKVLAAYQELIIDESKSSISPEISSILFGLVQIPAAIISAFMVDRLGRKVVIYIGEIGILIPLIAEGVYFYWLETGADVSNVSWIPTSGIVMYLIMHSVHHSVGYILLGELFRDNIKNVATMLFLTVGLVAMFIVTKTFQPIVGACGLYAAFWIYALFSLAAVVFTYFFLPETKGKTFDEIVLKIYK